MFKKEPPIATMNFDIGFKLNGLIWRGAGYAIDADTMMAFISARYPGAVVFN